MWYLLCNAATVLLSSAVLMFAMVTRSQCDKYHVFLDSYIVIIDFLIFVSAVQVIIAALKWCRLFRDDICSLTTLAILMAALSIIEMGIGFALWRQEHPVSSLRQSILKHDFSRFHKREVLKDWDTLQFQFECCGVKKYADWVGSVPESCCQKSDASTFDCTPQMAYKDGCLNNLNDPIRNNDYNMPWEICLELSTVNLIVEYFSYYLQRSRNSGYENFD